jgi:hypothetical protein
MVVFDPRNTTLTNYWANGYTAPATTTSSKPATTSSTPAQSSVGTALTPSAALNAAFANIGKGVSLPASTTNLKPSSYYKRQRVENFYIPHGTVIGLGSQQQIHQAQVYNPLQPFVNQAAYFDPVQKFELSQHFGEATRIQSSTANTYYEEVTDRLASSIYPDYYDGELPAGMDGDSVPTSASVPVEETTPLKRDPLSGAGTKRPPKTQLTPDEVAQAAVNTYKGIKDLPKTAKEIADASREVGKDLKVISEFVGAEEAGVLATETAEVVAESSPWIATGVLAYETFKWIDARTNGGASQWLQNEVDFFTGKGEFWETMRRGPGPEREHNWI